MRRIATTLLFFTILLLSCTEKQIAKTNNPIDPASRKLIDQISDAANAGSARINRHILFADQFTQSLDSFIPDPTDSGDQLGIIRANGFCTKNYGAADRRFDCLEFVILNPSQDVEKILERRGVEKTSSSVGTATFTINIQVPHIVDPGHVVEKSTVNNQVAIVIQFFPSQMKGGWAYQSAVMMFQALRDIDIPYKEEHTEDEYDHFYDGV